MTHGVDCFLFLALRCVALLLLCFLLSCFASSLADLITLRLSSTTYAFASIPSVVDDQFLLTYRVRSLFFVTQYR